jgi:hypothetical protein
VAIGNIKWVGVRPNKFKPEVTEVTLGFAVDGGDDLHFLNLPVAGGSEKQQKFASAVLATLLKQGGPYEVELETNERGYVDVVVPRQEGV